MTSALIIATDSRYLSGMTTMAHAAASTVIIAAVGPESLASQAAAAGADQIMHFPTDADTPAYAFAAAIEEYAASAGITLTIANDAPAARVLLASAARATNASVLAGVTSVAAAPAGFTAQCAIAGGVAIQNVEVAGTLAAIYGGTEASSSPATEPAPIQTANTQPSDLKIVERILPATGAVDLGAAERIIGVGRGVKTKDDLAAVEELAGALGATMACTLPISEDNGWYPAEQVLGSSHNSARPELYIALGISGSPNHMSGVKDAGVVVAVNNDPNATIFRHCDYGVVADLYQFVPALKAALE